MFCFILLSTMRIQIAIFFLLNLSLTAVNVFAQSPTTTAPQPKPEETELWKPVPPVVSPGADCNAPPSDAIILFNGKNLDEWVSVKDKSPAKWIVSNGLITVNKAAGNIETKRSFRDHQLHIEWKVPENITGSSQARGNSGVFLAATGSEDGGYELQVLDSYKNHLCERHGGQHIQASHSAGE